MAEISIVLCRYNENTIMSCIQDGQKVKESQAGSFSSNQYHHCPPPKKKSCLSPKLSTVNRFDHQLSAEKCLNLPDFGIKPRSLDHTRGGWYYMVIVQQIIYLSSQGSNIKIVCHDAHVFALLVYHYSSDGLNCEVYVERTSFRRQTVRIHATIQKKSKELLTIF